MTCIVNQQCCMPHTTVHFVFDVEAVGTPPRIWDIAIQNLCTGQLFHQFVDPQLDEYPPPPHQDLFHVTNTYLSENNAQPFRLVVTKLLQWVHSLHATHYVFMSHGCFVLDKQLIEAEFGREHLVVPSNWYFYDTLPFFRLQYKKQPSYALGQLYTMLFNEPIHNAHFALADTLALRRMLLACMNLPLVLPFHLSTRLVGCYYPAFYTPLQCVRFIGTYNETLLVMGGIQCVEDLYMLLRQQCRMNVDDLKNTLTTNYHIRDSDALKISQSILTMFLRPSEKTYRRCQN